MGPATEELFAVDSTMQQQQRLLAAAVTMEQKKATGQVVQWFWSFSEENVPY